jgi:D-alanyl-D-alanine carboxypeptidase/D-alanyl-D-alanine-endopeptidase (penicillin-binding protein 4)
VRLRSASLALAFALVMPGCAAMRTPPAPPAAPQLGADLDAIFDTPPFDTAVWSVRVEGLNGDVLYEKNPRTLVMPASNMKIVTMSAAAETLGWNHRFETRLMAEGEVRDGVLHGDLRVIGGGDPSIASANFGPSPLFDEWAATLRSAGITRVTGRIIGDDNAFDDEMLGAGWAWDYLAWGYAAPVSALQYNENVIVLRMKPGAREGDPADVLVSPPGHGLDVHADVRTAAATTTSNINLDRYPGKTSLTVTGTVPVGGAQAIRTASVPNPTLFFVSGFRDALTASGIPVGGPAVDVDDLETPGAAGPSRLIASHGSPPLSELAAYFMKVSQNLYGETLLKTMGRAGGATGSMTAGRAVVRKVLEGWGIGPGTYAMVDGSGLSRYDEVSAAMLTTILRKMYEDERHRGWFLATLPVGGYDGTLDTRMVGTELQRAVQAKTGSIANARALSGFLTAPSGERFIFSIIANNFLRPSSEVDAIAERALTRVLREASSAAPAARDSARR